MPKHKKEETDDLKPTKDVKIKQGQAKFKSVLMNIVKNGNNSDKKP